MHLLRLGNALCACLLVVTGLGNPARAEDSSPLIRYESTAPLMGCAFGIAAYGADRDAIASQVETAFNEARAIEAWLSNYRADSELSRVNRAAADSRVAVSDALFDLLSRSLEYSRTTEGAFDITVGPLVRVWGFHDGDGRMPDPAALGPARNAVSYQLVELDPARKTVHFRHAGVELDPGGIGKGYAVDRMVERLRHSGVQVALVNACHSSIYALGAPPDSPRGWPIEIENARGDAPTTVWLKNQSLSSSGSREKSFEAGGHTYSHILDPRTGEPAEGITAASVIAPTALESEVWSTAVFVNGLDWAARHLGTGVRVWGCPTGDGCRWVEPGR